MLCNCGDGEISVTKILTVLTVLTDPEGSEMNRLQERLLSLSFNSIIDKPHNRVLRLVRITAGIITSATCTDNRHIIHQRLKQRKETQHKFFEASVARESCFAWCAKTYINGAHSFIRRFVLLLLCLRCSARSCRLVGTNYASLLRSPSWINNRFASACLLHRSFRT